MAGSAVPIPSMEVRSSSESLMRRRRPKRSQETGEREFQRDSAEYFFAGRQDPWLAVEFGRTRRYQRPGGNSINRCLKAASTGNQPVLPLFAASSADTLPRAMLFCLPCQPEMDAESSAPALQLQPSLRLQYHRNAVPNLFPTEGKSAEVRFTVSHILPKVGLEPTPSCKDLILSPVRLPYPWYWKHVAVMLKGFGFNPFTMLP